jgi:hypothetical protein
MIHSSFLHHLLKQCQYKTAMPQTVPAEATTLLLPYRSELRITEANDAGSLLIAVLFHATVNFTPTLFVNPAETVNFYLSFAQLMCVAAFILVATAGPTHLVRQRQVSAASQRSNSREVAPPEVPRGDHYVL